MQGKEFLWTSTIFLKAQLSDGTATVKTPLTNKRLTCFLLAKSQSYIQMRLSFHP